MGSPIATFDVPTSRQGQTGKGQGGYTAYQFVAAIGEPVTVALRSPIPLETTLHVIQGHENWQLIDPDRPDTVILEGRRWEREYASTSPVTVADAEAARGRFTLTAENHPAPHCASCGLDDHSLRVHAGPLGDGRWATPFRLPAPVGDDPVDESLLWMAMDCASGWYINQASEQPRRSVTVQMAAEIRQPLKPETDYVLVAWNGDYEPMWDGRKRGGAAAVFTDDGTCIAQARTFWVALDND